MNETLFQITLLTLFLGGGALLLFHIEDQRLLTRQKQFTRSLTKPPSEKNSTTPVLQSIAGLTWLNGSEQDPLASHYPTN